MMVKNRMHQHMASHTGSRATTQNGAQGSPDLGQRAGGAKEQPKFGLQAQILQYRELQHQRQLGKLEGLKARGHSRHRSVLSHAPHADLLSHLQRQDEKVVDYSELPKQFNLADSQCRSSQRFVSKPKQESLAEEIKELRDNERYIDKAANI